jgi:hypothetical protein
MVQIQSLRLKDALLNLEREHIPTHIPGSMGHEGHFFPALEEVTKNDGHFSMPRQSDPNRTHQSHIRGLPTRGRAVFPRQIVARFSTTDAKFMNEEYAGLL